mmetsp:Transcript_58744/g.157041  ORF Transcript_58744/g.157041 Transcript_58744/m.157041 type:complete len:482 (-) Transcript_58744:131-1576(-)
MARRPGGPRQLSDVLDDLGMGLFQAKSLTLGGSVYFTAAAEIVIVGAVAVTVAKEFNLAPWQRGTLVSIIFIGALLGNLASGTLGDTFGRRVPILIGYLGMAVFAGLSTLATGFAVILVLWLLLGLCFGLGVPAWNSLCSEHSPTRLRALMNGTGQAVFSLGMAYAAILLYLDDPYLRNLHWRPLVFWAAVPGIVLFVLALLFLDESPAYYVVQGRPDRALRVLEHAAWLNGFEGSVAFDATAPVAPTGAGCNLEATMTVFNRRHAYTTITMVFAAFVVNFVYYGFIYALPQVLVGMDLPVSPAVNILIACLMELPGFAFGIYIGQTMDRIPSMTFYLGGIIFSEVVFILGAGVLTGELRLDGWTTETAQWTVVAGVNINRVIISVGWTVVYVYVTEVYPAICRVTGSAVCIGLGRLGAVFSSLIFEVAQEYYGSFIPFFVGTVIVCFLNMFMTQLLPYETRNMKLTDGEDEPLKPSSDRA